MQSNWKPVFNQHRWRCMGVYIVCCCEIFSFPRHFAEINKTDSIGFMAAILPIFIFVFSNKKNQKVHHQTKKGFFFYKERKWRTEKHTEQREVGLVSH